MGKNAIEEERPELPTLWEQTSEVKQPGLTGLQIEELRKPLSTINITKRKMAWGMVSYVQAWKVIEEANRVFNFNWSRETVYCREVCRYEVYIGKERKPGFKVGYEAKVRIAVAGIIKEGTGHGSGAMTDLFDCIESAAKEAESDAMKRALMMMGYCFGLALYDKEEEHVEDVSLRKKEQSVNAIKKELTPGEKYERARKFATAFRDQVEKVKNQDELSTLIEKNQDALARIHDRYLDLAKDINITINNMESKL